MQYHKGKDYQDKTLRKEDLNENPIISLNEWIDEAKNSGIEDYNAFHLSTSDSSGNVSGRIVLLKSIEKEKIIFFTDYTSRKGQQIAENKKVAATFYWGSLERQIRIEGTIEKTSEKINDEYFALRPMESQAAAIASNQSQIIKSRKELEANHSSLLQNTKFQRPNSWGGYSIQPTKIEFWQGKPNRLNDRILYKLENYSWNTSRLAP
jgi:pyridoxamine 5'-phosphate oxidase